MSEVLARPNDADEQQRQRDSSSSFLNAYRPTIRNDQQVAIRNSSNNIQLSSDRRMDVNFPRPAAVSGRWKVVSILLAAMALSSLWSSSDSIPATDYARRTKNVMSKVPLIDGHNDHPYLIRVELKNRIYDQRYSFREGLLSPTDLVKLKLGGLGGQFWSAYVPCAQTTDDFNEATHELRDTLEQIDVSRRLFDEYEELEYCSNSSCVLPAFNSGRVASMIGVEGLHQVGQSIAGIRTLFELGARYITITHNCNNVFATCATHVAAGGEDRGLTQLGRSAIFEMNRLGMLVDLSHVSTKTMEDVLAMTRSPVIFSHSNARSVSSHLRNAPDHVLRQLKTNGGLIMVTFVPKFVNSLNPETANIEQVVDHIYKIVEMAGWDHVGIGGDFDAIVDYTEGLKDVTCYPQLIEAVMKRGATDKQVMKLLGENLLRVWSENERNAARFQASGELPSEDVWEDRVWTRWNDPMPQMYIGSENYRIQPSQGLP